MTPSREEALFALALEKPAEKRPAFLDAVCEGDTALRACLEALLQHDRLGHGPKRRCSCRSCPSLSPRFLVTVPRCCFVGTN